MISKIPTPNALVETSLWPIVKVTLASTPTEGELRMALGKLRLLRARGAPHFVIVDALELQEIPDRDFRERIVEFVHEASLLGDARPIGAVVVAKSQLLILATKAILRACGHADTDIVVSTVGAALARAKLVLGAQVPSLLRPRPKTT